MPSQHIICQADAFTSSMFKGNPAGVCILDSAPDPVWMQNIAMEMNLSETAFVLDQSAELRGLVYFRPVPCALSK